MAWLKVSEGCDRHCTFCIIPTLRGRLRSRSVASLVTEAKNLVAQGVKELHIISQDLSSYGKDLDEKNKLQHLLQGLETVEGLHWIRLYYYYPDDLSEEVIEIMANSKKICAYLDMPVQHFSDRILKLMNRRIKGSEILAKIKRIRERIPNIVLRTSLIVGFPGETEEDVEILMKGLEEVRFDHLGVFKYSDEEGTPAYHLPNKLSQEVIDERHEQVYELQKQLSDDLLNEKYVGKTLEVLVEGPHEETDLLWQGRFYGQAPDIDGKVIINDINDGKTPQAGDLVRVRISEAHEYDLVGSIIA
jgi:ribosomal protein S12 methylthiotransferase